MREILTTIRQNIDQSWERFLGVLDNVPEERMEEAGACGDWSVKDVMAHVAFWDDRDAFVANKLAAGEEVESLDWREANAQEAALRAGWTLEESRRELHAAHERLVEAVDRHPDHDWDDDTFEHYDEHADDVRAWLGA